jgi:hypothetical protein
MQKVKLVFEKNFMEMPTMSDTFSTNIEFALPHDFEQNGVHLIGARVYGSEPTPTNPSDAAPNPPRGDSNSVVIRYEDFRRLQGRLLTYIDATFNDPEQRKAHKDILKSNLYDWEKELHDRAVQVNDAQGRNTAAQPDA